jgi:lysophospholipase L1-like esterase
LCGVLAEVAVRVVLPSSASAFRDATTDWQPDRRLGWVQKPNLNLATPEADGSILSYRTNPDGLAPATAVRDKPAGTLRVMMFGDSTVVGRAVAQDQTVNAQLERALGSVGVRAEVINAGVEGYSTDQELLRIEELLPLYRPDIVTLTVCENDFGGNALNKVFGLNKPVFILENGSLTEKVPPPNDAIMDAAHSGSRKWLRYSALYRALAPRLSILRAKFSPWEEQSLLGIVPEFYYREEELGRIDWKLFSAMIQRMRQSCAAHGARFLFCLHPAVAEVWDPFIQDTIRARGLKPGQYDRYALEKRLRGVAKDTTTDFCPLIDYFVTRQERGPFHLLPRDPHCNPAGYQTTAEALARHMQQHGLAKKVPTPDQRPAH